MARTKMEFKEPTNKEEELKLYKRKWARENAQRNKANNDRVNRMYKKIRELKSTLSDTVSCQDHKINYFIEVE